MFELLPSSSATVLCQIYTLLNPRLLVSGQQKTFLQSENHRLKENMTFWVHSSNLVLGIRAKMLPRTLRLLAVCKIPLFPVGNMAVHILVLASIQKYTVLKTGLAACGLSIYVGSHFRQDTLFHSWLKRWHSVFNRGDGAQLLVQLPDSWGKK